MHREIGFGDKCGVERIGSSFDHRKYRTMKVFEQNGDMMEVVYTDNLSSERGLWSNKRD